MRFVGGFCGATLSPEFLNAAIQRGDRCVVLIAGQRVAAPAGKGLAGYINASNVTSLLSHWNSANQQLGIALVWP